jgi:hypothetical protein
MERLRFKEECVEYLERAVTSYTQQRRGNHTFRVAHGWRCDAPGTHEALVFTGWETAQTHVTLIANVDDGHDIAVLQDQSERVPIIRGRNLERKDG